MASRSRFPDVSIPDNISLTEYVLKGVDRYQDNIAFVNHDGSEPITHREFRTRVRNVASALYRRGLRHSDVICIFSPNSVDYPVMFLAATWIGCVVTTTNPLYKLAELVHQLEDASVKYIATIPALLALVQTAAEKQGHIQEIFVFGAGHDLPEAGVPFSDLFKDDGTAFPDDVSIRPKDDIIGIPYSSGTTGPPKGVMHTHYSMIACICQHSIPEITAIVDAGENICLAVLPFYHIFGLLTYCAFVIKTGATAVVMPRFDIKTFLKSVETHKVTVLHIVPPLAVMLAKHPEVANYDLSSVRTIICGAAPLKRELCVEITARIGVTDFRQVYGMTEVMGSHVVPNDDIVQGSAGVLLPNAECKIVDLETGLVLPVDKDGEVCLRGPMVMKGYLNNRQATAETIGTDGWLRTGDIGHQDKHGHLFIVDRLKELIKYNAYQVAPAELEQVLLQHEAVSEAAVIGVPDEKCGELPKAYIIKRPNTDVTSDQLITFVEDRVAPHKKLRGGVEFVDHIPKAASGKILRRELKEKLQMTSK